MPKIKSEVLTAQELAYMFGVTRRTIYQNAKQGHLPVIKLGRRLFFPKRAIFTWLKTAKLPKTKFNLKKPNRPLPLQFKQTK